LQTEWLVQQQQPEEWWPIPQAQAQAQPNPNTFTPAEWQNPDQLQEELQNNISIEDFL
jgi:hypothetical protein